MWKPDKESPVAGAAYRTKVGTNLELSSATLYQVGMTNSGLKSVPEMGDVLKLDEWTIQRVGVTGFHMKQRMCPST